MVAYWEEYSFFFITKTNLVEEAFPFLITLNLSFNPVNAVEFNSIFIVRLTKEEKELSFHGWFEMD